MKVSMHLILQSSSIIDKSVLLSAPLSPADRLLDEGVLDFKRFFCHPLAHKATKWNAHPLITSPSHPVPPDHTSISEWKRIAMRPCLVPQGFPVRSGCIDKVMPPEKREALWGQ
jgi:hypothetical protein